MQRIVRGWPSGMRTSRTGATDRGLYSAGASGIQKSQKRADAFGPESFAVLSAFDALVVQIVLEPPAFFEKQVTKSFDILHDARSFARADVQPNARLRFDTHRLHETVDDELVPPN